MVLHVEDHITLDTPNGRSVIQLLLGDITLSLNDKVDIIFTSAIPGAYGTGDRRTLFYSLKSKLGIDVGSLAKEEIWDGRKNLNCWLSDNLPPDKPFRRLACLEVPHTDNMYEHISALFSATVPIFTGKENSIITPLLGTGCQDEFLDVIYWMRQIMGLVLGLIWGLIPLKGIFGLGLFLLVNVAIVYIYYNNFQRIDEEEYGGASEILKEGLMTSFSSFLVAWIILYSALHTDSSLPS